MGNMDTINDLKPKTENEVYEITKRMVSAAKKNGRYIFCTGEGIVHDTPANNISSLVRAVHEWGSYE